MKYIDQLAALPPKARAKFQVMLDELERSRAERAGLADRIAALREDVNHRHVVRRSRAMTMNEPPAPETDDERRLRGEMRRLQTIADDAGRRTEPLVQSVARCREWIVSIVTAGSRIVDVHPPAPKGDPVRALAEVRDQIARLGDELAVAAAAPAPASDLRRRATEALDRLAAAGKPSVYASNRANDPLNLERLLKLQSVVSDGGVGRMSDDATALIAWLLHDTLAAKINALIDAEPLIGAMSDADRERALKDLAARRLATERVEEACIQRAADAGIVIPRRPDADPRAVLMVEDK